MATKEMDYFFHYIKASVINFLPVFIFMTKELCFALFETCFYLFYFFSKKSCLYEIAVIDQYHTTKQTV